MKKIALLALAGTMLAALSGCSLKTVGSFTYEKVDGEPYYKSPEEVTVEKITELMKPKNMIQVAGGYKVTYTYHGFGGEGLDESSVYTAYRQTGELIESNQIADFPDGYFTYVYFSNNPQDAFIYSVSNDVQDKQELGEDGFEEIMNRSIQGYENYKAILNFVTDQGDTYIANIEVQENDAPIFVDNVTIDVETGCPTHIETVMEDNREMGIVLDIEYAGDTEITQGPKSGLDELIEKVSTAVIEEETTAAKADTKADKKATKKAKKEEKKAKKAAKKTKAKKSAKKTAKKTKAKKSTKKAAKKTKAKKSTKKTAKKKAAKKSSR